MNIELIGNPKTIISNPHSHHGYFAWPTVSRLQDGKIAVGASGFRVEHVCPFGKAVISYSQDGGETYTLPAPVIDTPLDDRDAGICPFGESGVIFTSFNNSAEMQREYNQDDKYVQSYIDTITKEDEEKYKYYPLKNLTDYQETTYYTLSNQNKKVVILLFDIYINSYFTLIVCIRSSLNNSTN